MRWALVKVALTVASMVTVAFAVPLALVVKETARNRAFSSAERQAAAIGPALAITGERDALEKAVASTSAGAAGRMAVHVPAQRASGTPSGGAQAPDAAPQGRDGATDPGEPGAPRGSGRRAFTIGTSRANDRDVATVRRREKASVPATDQGNVLLRPTVLASGAVAVIEVYIPEHEVTRGVGRSWLILAGVGLALIVGSVATADRLGTRLVRPAERLADAAHELGEGEFGVRVAEEGPRELRSAATAFNSMADHLTHLLTNERELAADLSHRLRTPLTVLRLNAASLGGGAAAEQTREAVAQLEHEVDQIIRTAREQRTHPPQSQTPPPGCDAAEVVRERMEFWSALAEDEGRSTRLTGVGEPVRVPLSRPELTAALDAMLGNVFRHTPQGTAFTVDVRRSPPGVGILVRDAGPGIADPQRALRRGHGDGGPGSTGLGLDIVRRAAEATGGEVAVGRSTLGGAEVGVWLALDSGRAEGDRRRPGRR